MKQTFYVCNHCKNIVSKVKNGGGEVVCCGEPMQELVPGTSDGAAEKHVPVYSVEGNVVKVAVGEVAHPMADVHYIEWIAIETKKGSQMKQLAPVEEPKAEFVLTEDDAFVAVYAYCNLHGLWKAEA